MILGSSLGTQYHPAFSNVSNLTRQGQDARQAQVAGQLPQEHRESFPPLQVRCRNGETKLFWTFTKTGRLNPYGRKRLVIVHQQQDLSHAPCFLLTDALH